MLEAIFEFCGERPSMRPDQHPGEVSYGIEVSKRSNANTAVVMLPPNSVISWQIGRIGSETGIHTRN